jgi:ribosomal protein L37AE/L43A
VKSANCPSCGAPVSFRSALSVYAVCDFCRSTLLRSGEDLQNLGRMADLLEDASLIQVGTEGTHRGMHFGVLGRIQLKHASGIWNEWHILFDDGRSGWLSEASGEFVVSAQVAVSEALPAFETLRPEMPVNIAGRRFAVTDLQTARCVSGQGELPFKVDAGYDVNTADLRSNDRFVTLDYSETPPLVFVGQPTTFDALKLANLRQSSAGIAPTVQARAFNCPHCASPLSIHSVAIESVACDSCGSIIGIENDSMKLLARAAQGLREPPWLPLGSKGKLHDIAWEVIGYLRRKTTSAGVDYLWDEYLLFNVEQGFAWLTEYQGHWNYVRTLSSPPSVSLGAPKFIRNKEEFKLFSSAEARVVYVVGEFYWRVAVGETAMLEDYICPPLMLSREVTANEASWSQGEYLEPEALCAAFKITVSPPKRKGVYANQPNPLIERHRGVCHLFWKLGLLATVVQLLFVYLFASQLVLKQRLVLSPFADETTLTTQEFSLQSRARALLVRHNTDVENNWLGLTTTLVEKNTGEAFLGVQEISHYKGVDDGESWAEGAKDDAIVFKNLPPGNYYLVVEYEIGTDRRAAIADTIEVVRNPVGWSNYVLALIFLVVFPLFSRWRRNAFETKRWAESDLTGGKGDDSTSDAGDIADFGGDSSDGGGDGGGGD